MEIGKRLVTWSGAQPLAVRFVLLLIAAAAVASIPASFAVAHAFHGIAWPGTERGPLPVVQYLAGIIYTAAFVLILETAAVGLKTMTLEMPWWSGRLTVFSWALIGAAVLANYSQGGDMYRARADLSPSLALAQGTVYGEILVWAMAGAVPVILALNATILVHLLRVQREGPPARIPLARRLRAWWTGTLAESDQHLARRLAATEQLAGTLAQVASRLDALAADMAASRQVLTNRLDTLAAEVVQATTRADQAADAVHRLAGMVAQIDHAQAQTAATVQAGARAEAAIHIHHERSESGSTGRARALVQVDDAELVRWASPVEEGGEGATMAVIAARLGHISRGAARDRVSAARRRLSVEG